MLSELSGIYIIVFVVTLVISLVVHEVMHGLSAKWLGDDTAEAEGRLTLNPLRHIDPVMTILLPLILVLAHLPPILAAKPVPFNPERLKFDEFGAAIVGISGPLTNLALAAVGAVIFRLIGGDLSSVAYNSIIIFTEVNVLLFVFNMIPFPPLDGSRLLYAFAPEPLQDLMRQIESLGFLVLLMIIFFGFQFIAGPIINIQSGIVEFLLV